MLHSRKKFQLSNPTILLRVSRATPKYLLKNEFKKFNGTKLLKFRRRKMKQAPPALNVLNF